MLPWICSISSFTSSHCLHNFPIFPSIFVASFSTSTPGVSFHDNFVNRHQFSPQCAQKVSYSLSTDFLLKHQNLDSVINFFKEYEFSENQIQTVIRKAPFLLSSNLETSVKPKFRVFKELGFESADIADIISTSPSLLRSSADRIRHSILVLKNVLGPDADILGLIRISGSQRLLAHDLDSNLAPNIEYLKSCGICPQQIITRVCRHPTKFIVKLEKLKEFVERVDEMGLPRESKRFMEAIGVMSSMSRKTWELKLKLFRELGFSEQDILVAFRKSPSTFSKSERKIRETIELLLSFMDISYIVFCPYLICYSLEKRLKPRLRVLMALESKNLLKIRPSLCAFCLISDEEFMKKYVIPYSDKVGDLFFKQTDSASEN